ncbi:uroporphyrinogen-III synthase [Fluviibacterium sp. DFM31]|uniref:Uroporphyrinogen-III synthase n=1 Tax=Meridianimarinicoccus marinus TaxID=3231483 RepID=A0ABV3L832_9RHOB
MILLLTRPAAQSARFAAQVRARLGDRFRIVIAPVLDIVETPAARTLAQDATWDGVGALAFTSENAVTMFARYVRGRRLLAFCVGERTAEAARACGLDALQGPGNARGLVRLIARHPPEGRVLHLGGVHLARDLVADLADRGIAATHLAIYDQHPRPLTEEARTCLQGPDPVLVPLFSPRSARLLAPDLSRARAELRLAAISPAVAEAGQVQSGVRMEVAPTPDADAMLDLIQHLSERG